ncbi:MAG: hypothetical protein ACREPQ_14320 [Rhodanobacter sp.]
MPLTGPAPLIVTLTGADHGTDLSKICALTREYPRLEVGLLYSATPEGRNRYPSRPWLREAAQALNGRCAIHVCGTKARQELLAGDLAGITGYASRVQVNGRLMPEEVPGLARLARVLITQHTEANAQLVGLVIPNHQLLIDGSGGRGISPGSWTRPTTEKPVGFAGGLSPANVLSQLQAICSVDALPSWIDMESSLRNTDDWFDLGVCREVLRLVTAGHEQ